MVAIAAPTLTVIDTYGMEKQYTIAQIGKITFEPGKIFLYGHDGQMLGWNNLNDVGQVAIEDEATAIESVTPQLQVFADPEQQQMVVVGLSENQTVRVFDTTGKLLFSTPSQTEQTRVDVSTLQNGTYLLQFGAQVVKFVKQ